MRLDTFVQASDLHFDLRDTVSFDVRLDSLCLTPVISRTPRTAQKKLKLLWNIALRKHESVLSED